jgi:hypothetical protein
MMTVEVPVFPKRNTRFKLEDFFQVEVDEFNHGNFLFLSAKKVKVILNDKLLEEIESIDEDGWVISTYCYDTKFHYKIFICDYKARAWRNNYNIRSLISLLNCCDGFSVHSPIQDFIEWMEIIN